ncbi:rabphilin-3A-like [Xenia sp. Carnegie-2017]|uniref:rabphilin-3A-like n=1 Tax=Xenia sp. Carnegie-2017 TaxID=2897299 RepID=UPI001F04B724|nr:rabphilin-3A-like [Xenia sp. Carnegie-2017]
MNSNSLPLKHEDPWVCPNDRELGLRAKLGSGWSFYTNRAWKKEPIKDDEISIIKEQIKKAEVSRNKEEYRIGLLLDRLENIKNNAQGNGITTCLLCNEKFGKITAAPVKCSICQKAACGKCGVDTLSSANAPIFLCKLCNEHREFWKKSGAWFYRQLPKHKLPSVRDRNYLMSSSFIVSTPEVKNRKGTLLSQENVSEMYSDSEADSYPSSGAEDVIVSGGFVTNKSNYSENLTEIKKNESNPIPGFMIDNTSSPDSHTSSPLSSSRRSSEQDSHNVSDDDTYSFKTNVLVPNSEKRGSDYSIGSGTSDVSRSSNVSSQPLNNQQHGALTPSSKGSSEQSLGSRTSNVSPVLTRTSNVVTKPPTNQRAGVKKSNVIGNKDLNEDPKGPLGVIEFTISYTNDEKRLDVHIHNAKGLPAMDFNGLADPYVKAHLLPGASKSNKKRTRTLQNTLDPVFNETLTYSGLTETDMKNKTLRLQVFDEDKLSRNNFIGETTIPLTSVLSNNQKRIKIALEPKSETGVETMKIDDCPGRIYLSLLYNSKSNILVVGIIRCSNLIAMDMNGFSDPYVKCYLLPDPGKKTKRRTKVKKKNLNPEFGEEFFYNVTLKELASRTLEVTVWDHDVGKSNDFIGGIHLGIRSKDLLLKHWFETLKHPDTECKYWHNLSKDIVLHEAE